MSFSKGCGLEVLMKPPFRSLSPGTAAVIGMICSSAYSDTAPS